MNLLTTKRSVPQVKVLFKGVRDCRLGPLVALDLFRYGPRRVVINISDTLCHVASPILVSKSSVGLDPSSG